MSPTKTNASESSRPRKPSTQRQRTPSRKQRKIPKTLDGVPVYIYGAKWNDFMNGDAIIQPRDVSESAPSSLNVKTPQDTVNLASSCIPPADFVYSKIPASTQMYLGAEPSHGVPEPFQYDLPPEDIFPSTNQPCQSYAGRYDQSCHFLPSSSSTGSLSMEHCVEPYQQWLDPKFPNAQYIIPQPILSYASNASSTFPDDLDNIYAGSSHSMMTSANDGTGTTLPFPFPNYDAKYLHSYDYMPR